MLIWSMAYNYPNECWADALLLSIDVDPFLELQGSGMYENIQPLLKRYCIGTIRIEYDGQQRVTPSITTGPYNLLNDTSVDKNVTCHCGKSFAVTVTDSRCSPKRCPVCNCEYVPNDKGGQWRLRMGITADCQKQTSDDSEDLLEAFYSDLTIKGCEATIDRDFRKATELFEKAVRILPDEPTARIRLADSRSRLAMTSSESQAILDELDKIEVLISRGQAKMQHNKFLGRDDVELIRGRCYLLLGDQAKAETHLKSALKIVPDSSEARELLNSISKNAGFEKKGSFISNAFFGIRKLLK
jgi:tetratricopeptide (TPR) repeat protein